MSKYREGRDEPILEPELRIIDAHHHLFVRPDISYLYDDYRADATAGHNIVASVYVETQSMARPDGPELLRPLGEIEFANGVAAMAESGTFGGPRVAAAIVGYADLSQGDAVGEILARAVAIAPGRLRGIRQIALSHPDPSVLAALNPRPHPELLGTWGFGAGMRQLARHGLSFDATVFHHQLPELARLARANPDVPIVLDHLGIALGLGLDAGQRRQVFGEWKASLSDIAGQPNVTCKIGGLGSPFWGFGFHRTATALGYLDLAQEWAPYVETAIEAFGADRCMMASNYPPDGRSCGFVPLWNALKHIVRHYSPTEKHALFHDTAARVYRIEGVA